MRKRVMGFLNFERPKLQKILSGLTTFVKRYDEK